MRLAAGNFRNCAMHAAAMEFVPELEAELSPPVQREGMLIQSSNRNASSGSNHLHHKTSTQFAGRVLKTVSKKPGPFDSPHRSNSTDVIEIPDSISDTTKLASM